MLQRSNNADDFFSRYSGEVQTLARDIRKFVLATLPGINEEIDLPAKMVAYTYGKRYADMICTVIPSKKGIKLGFYKGVDLPDRAKVLKGTGKFSRYVELNSTDDIKTKVLKQLLKEALRAYKSRDDSML